MPVSAENSQVLLSSQSASKNNQLSPFVRVNVSSFTSTKNSPVGISFVVDTGKTVAVHREGSRSDTAKLQGPPSEGDSAYGLLVVYAQMDPVLGNVE